APVGADGAVVTLEDTAYGFKTLDFGFSDPTDTPPNSLSAVIITSLPTSGTLALTGTPITAGQLPKSISVGSIAQLTFTPALDKNDGNQARPTFTFKVQDNGGTFNNGVDTSFSNNTVSVSVTAVNDGPVAANKTV